MFVLGLTGSLGMGKSATAKMFAEAGVPVHDADAAVHRLYEGEATPLIEAAFPGTTTGGKVDRDKLAQRVFGDSAAIKKLESIVHPLVRCRPRKVSQRSRAQRCQGRWSSTFRYFSKPEATNAATQSSWFPRPPLCSMRAYSSAPE